MRGVLEVDRVGASVVVEKECVDFRGKQVVLLRVVGSQHERPFTVKLPNKFLLDIGVVSPRDV